MPDLRDELAKRAAYGEGNINLFTRPLTRNPDGSRSSLYSTSGEDEHGQEVLIPGVGEHGQGILPEGKAWPQYERTGHYLGKFTGPDRIPRADMLGEYLHKEGASGLTTPPMATSRSSPNPEHFAQVLQWLLQRNQ